MTLTLIEEILNIPKDCEINNVIPKKDIFEIANSKTNDKNTFTKYVKQIKWIYKFDEYNLKIKPYKDDKREYLEIELINIILKEENLKENSNSNTNYINSSDNNNENTKSLFKQDGKLDRITDIIFRFIPHPIILVFEYKDKIRIFLSHISDSLVDSEKITVDKIVSTDWINTNNPNDIEKTLFNDLNLNNADFSNCYNFYDKIIQRIIKYNGSKTVGKEISVPTEEIEKINDQIEELNKEIAIKKAELKKETQFNEKMDLNIKIKKLKDKKENLKGKLI